MADQVQVARERYIPVSKRSFVRTLASLLDEPQRQPFRELAAHLEKIFRLKTQKQAEEIKRSYIYFDCHNDLREEEQRDLAPPELDEYQNLLVKNFFSVLTQANFSPISYEYYKSALQAVYLSDLPIQVDWPRLDWELFEQCFDEYPEFKPYPNEGRVPPFHRHFALYYRGIGLSKKSGMYFNHKLNIISEDMFNFVYWIAQSVVAALGGSLSNQKKKAEKRPPPPADLSYDEKSGAFKTANMASEWVTRVSLVDTYKDSKENGLFGIFSWIIRSVELQEPTFKRLALMYRSFPEDAVSKGIRHAKELGSKVGKKVLNEKVQSRIKIAAKKVIESNSLISDSPLKQLLPDETEQDEKAEEMNPFQSNRESVYSEMNVKRRSSLLREAPITSVAHESNIRGPIRMFYFADIPIADLETVYPCKRLSLKTFDKVYLAVIIAMGVYTILVELFDSEQDSWWWVAWAIGCVVLMVRAILWYRSKEDLYTNTLNMTLYQSNISTDVSMLLSLVDQVEEQNLFETLIAYVMLLNHDEKNLQPQEVDRLCEAILKNKFQQKVNVEIGDAVKKLRELNLLRTDTDGSLHVAPLSDAVRNVKDLWREEVIDSFLLDDAVEDASAVEDRAVTPEAKWD